MLVLASSSPRRRELLTNAGIEFIVDPAHIDERQRPGEAAIEFARRLAREKAEAVAARHLGKTVLGADTIVIVEGEVLGKPADAEDAKRMLRKLANRAHQVSTAVAILADRRIRDHVETTTVMVGAITSAEIDAYVAHGEPMDKAGAYAIQGWASRWIERIEGDYFNVVGLPVAAVWKMLKS